MFHTNLENLTECQNNPQAYDTLLSTLNQIPAAITVTDLESRYLIINETTADLQNLNTHTAQGLTYHDMKCGAAQLATHYINQDKKVITNKNTLKILGVQKLGTNDDWTILFGSKKPFLNAENQIIGVISHFMEVTEFILSPFIRKILTKTMSHHTSKQFEISIDNHYEDLNLTPRQAEVFFFVLRGKTSKEIASILHRSPRTVETYIDHIKNKLNCYTKSELIEKGITAGYLGILPETLFKQLY